MTDEPGRSSWAESTAWRVGRRVAELRKVTGVSAQTLEKSIEDLGHEFPKGALAKLENGRRGVSLPEVILLAAALGVSPIDLLAPKDAADAEVLPGVSLDARAARLWFQGAAGTIGSLANDWRGEAEENLARELADAAYYQGSSLERLRSALPSFPEEVFNSDADPSAARAALHGLIREHLAKLSQLTGMLEHLDSVGDRGDD